MFKAEFQVVVDGLIRHFAQQREIRNANLPFLGAFKDRFLDLGSAMMSFIGSIGGGLRTPKAPTLLFTSRPP
jgi:hypothetical protein